MGKNLGKKIFAQTYAQKKGANPFEKLTPVLIVIHRIKFGTIATDMLHIGKFLRAVDTSQKCFAIALCAR